ncbi:hypothetical protein L6164_033172 [Bauhinia variegata]|uniref:Uncharacterized protein n=1 Tax=Bauhinia variegata TaxID=167791 RepID=A0ACB9KRS6_BAUVA|nr:hypothetical protein L6164_033172 [Bauhinia variegata]
MTLSKRSRALEKANAFRSQFPSFIVVMKPSYVDSYGPLNIPVDFVSKYLDLEKKRGIVTLQVLDGREWSITFVIRINGRRPKFELSNGWKAFARANNLNLGDVCVFELINKTEIAFRVSIFRDSDSLNHRFSQGNFKLLYMTSSWLRNFTATQRSLDLNPVSILTHVFETIIVDFI